MERENSFQVSLENSTEKTRNEEMLPDPKVHHWVSLKKVCVCSSMNIALACSRGARCWLFIQILTSVCTENGLSIPIHLSSNVNAD